MFTGDGLVTRKVSAACCTTTAQCSRDPRNDNGFALVRLVVREMPHRRRGVIAVAD